MTKRSVLNGFGVSGMVLGAALTILGFRVFSTKVSRPRRAPRLLQPAQATKAGPKPREGETGNFDRSLWS